MTAGGAYTLKAATISSLPFKIINDKSKVITLVDNILRSKNEDRNADISKLEVELNSLVYAIYELSEEEITTIETMM